MDRLWKQYSSNRQFAQSTSTLNSSSWTEKRIPHLRHHRHSLSPCSVRSNIPMWTRSWHHQRTHQHPRMHSLTNHPFHWTSCFHLLPCNRIPSCFISIKHAPQSTRCFRVRIVHTASRMLPTAVCWSFIVPNTIVLHFAEQICSAMVVAVVAQKHRKQKGAVKQPTQPFNTRSCTSSSVGFPIRLPWPKWPGNK